MHEKVKDNVKAENNESYLFFVCYALFCFVWVSMYKNRDTIHRETQTKNKNETNENGKTRQNKINDVE